MTKEKVYELLDEVFRDVFDDDGIHVTAQTTSADIEDWDSLENINLVVAAEEKFGVKFNMGEVVKFRNVGEMADAILARVK